MHSDKCTCYENANLVDKPSSIIPVIGSRKKKIITSIGKCLAGIFSFSCGVTNANALVVSGLLTGGASYICAAILFLAVILVNYKIFKSAVPKILISMFGEKNSQNASTSHDNLPLSPIKKTALFFGSILSISAGATLGALAYSSIFSFLGTISFFSALSVAFPPLGIILGIITFVCISSLMFDAIDEMLRTTDFIRSCKNFLYNLIDIDPELPRHKNKSTFRIVTERIATLCITVVSLPLALTGLFMTMSACAPGLGKLLMNIPNAIPDVVDVACKVICYGLALLAQAPFVIRTAFLTVASIFNSSPREPSMNGDKMDNPNRLTSCIKNIVFQIARALSAVGNGLVAMMGASNMTTTVLAGGGGAFNTFSAAVADSAVKESDSTAAILRHIPVNQHEHTNTLTAHNKPALVSKEQVYVSFIDGDDVLEIIPIEPASADDQINYKKANFTFNK
ncbi:MAG: hypothetical protein ABI597_02660 [Gammaproteobacteria bacterium]